MKFVFNNLSISGEVTCAGTCVTQSSEPIQKGSLFIWYDILTLANITKNAKKHFKEDIKQANQFHQFPVCQNNFLHNRKS